MFLLASISENLSEGISQVAPAILVGDDDPGVRRVLELGFRRAGLTVHLACDGEAVLEQFAHHRGDIQAVLMDVDMPKMSGISALTRLRRIDPNVRVLLMSGARRFTIHEVSEMGAAGFLVKPFRLLELVQGVLALLNQERGPTRGRN